MLNRFAIVLAFVLAGCGASRPQRPTQTYDAAFAMYVSGESLDGIKTSLALSDTAEARAMVRSGLMRLYHRYNNER